MIWLEAIDFQLSFAQRQLYTRGERRFVLDGYFLPDRLGAFILERVG
jgi:hypothetical protein